MSQRVAESLGLSWPESRPHLAGVRGWLSSVLAARQPVPGPERVLWAKSWGVTAVFSVDGRHVVFKDSSPVVFPGASAVYDTLGAAAPGAAPQVLAHEQFAGHDWFAFEFVPGPTGKQAGAGQAAGLAVRTLARVQEKVAVADLSGLPRYDLIQLPDALAADMADQPADLRAAYGAALPDLRGWAAELAAAIPASLDHPDLNLSNALITPGGHAVIVDWEEAAVGCPLFSVERLTDADSVPDPAIARHVVDTYLRLLPWGGLPELRRCYELSRRLVLLQRAAEARAWARALGRPDPHTHLTSKLLAEALSRAQPGPHHAPQGGAAL